MGKILAARRPVAVAVISILLLAALIGVGIASIAAVLGEGSGPQITTDKPAYGGYELVTITGTGFDSEQVLDVPVVRPDGSIVTGDGTNTPGFDTLIADAGGGFTYYYQLNGYPTGTYTVEVYDNSDTGHETLLASTTFIDGQIQRLELKYRDFGFGTSVQVTLVKDQKKGHLDPPGGDNDHGPITVAADGTFAVENDTAWHDLGSGTELQLYNGTETITIKIHTSCSKPIGVGFLYGDSDETADGPFSPEDPDDDNLRAYLEITALTEESCGDSHVPSIKVCKEVLPEPGDASTWDFTLNWSPLDVLNLQTDQTMSTAISPTGNIDINHGQTKSFTATWTTVGSASNADDWTLVLVLRDKPDEPTSATITVWWQNGGACSDGAVPGQIFATGSAAVPIASDKEGHSLTVPKTGGTVSHTFVSGDLLCMSLSNDGTAGANDIHAYANNASTSGTDGVSRLEGSFTLDTADSYSGLGDGQCHTFINLTPSSYTLAEATQAGYTTSVSCDSGKGSDTDNDITFTLNSAEDVTCTFTNTQQPGTIIVVKDAIPNDPQDFTFTNNIPGCSPSFDLDDDTEGTLSNTQTCSNVAPGTYSVSETVPAGWDLTSATCSDGSPVSAIVLDPGETVTCTFTNTKQPGHIIVDKVTVPSPDPQSFDFTTDYGSPFSLTDAATPNDSGPLPPSTYSVSETVPAGWDLTSATCSDGSPVSAIVLDPGETVTCTFTNTKREEAAISMVKSANPTTINPGEPVTFTYTITNTGNTYVSVYNLEDSVYEDITSSASCSPTLPALLAPDAQVSCTYTADPGPSIDQTNIGTATANPTDAAGNDLPGVDDVQASHDAFVNVGPVAVGGIVELWGGTADPSAHQSDRAVPYHTALASALAAGAIAVIAGALYARRRWLR